MEKMVDLWLIIVDGNPLLAKGLKVEIYGKLWLKIVKTSAKPPSLGNTNNLVPSIVKVDGVTYKN